MNDAKQEGHPWMAKAFGRYLLDWEQQRCDEAVADIFGYHSVQLGWPLLQALRHNRMPNRWVAAQSTDWNLEPGACQVPEGVQLLCAPEALPFAESSVDLLVMPHTLEHCQDPHAALREAVRVLVPEGRLLLFGLNPYSLWGLQHGLERVPEPGLNAWRGLPYWRVRDWLQVLAMDVVAADFGCHAPALEAPAWLQRWRWMDRLGNKAWPVLGGAYCVLAVKRVHGMRLLEPAWRKRAPAAQARPAAACQQAPQRK
ncbi:MULTISPECIES: class I SAM-dependent methyltransferase [Comamonas]|uniref:Class I SAM-dependent methyltransferase n=1 Tax=Comamonas aquatica TaxID=225991 RepID=A0AA42HZN4_9BURK|nr:class I SAM-dependent methyltransferase [Comamonas aquatica]MDE1554442.1 class I SAM-dependent methyltransferase [Comamonas aquatica]MDH0363225.1 class I SAM-dependent methyltransferase [Comamonas aquatica]